VEFVVVQQTSQNRNLHILAVSPTNGNQRSVRVGLDGASNLNDLVSRNSSAVGGYAVQEERGGKRIVGVAGETSEFLHFEILVDACRISSGGVSQIRRGLSSEGVSLTHDELLMINSLQDGGVINISRNGKDYLVKSDGGELVLSLARAYIPLVRNSERFNGQDLYLNLDNTPADASLAGTVLRIHAVYSSLDFPNSSYLPIQGVFNEYQLAELAFGEACPSGMSREIMGAMRDRSGLHSPSFDQVAYRVYSFSIAWAALETIRSKQQSRWQFAFPSSLHEKAGSADSNSSSAVFKTNPSQLCLPEQEFNAKLLDEGIQLGCDDRLDPRNLTSPLSEGGPDSGKNELPGSFGNAALDAAKSRNVQSGNARPGELVLQLSKGASKNSKVGIASGSEKEDDSQPDGGSQSAGSTFKPVPISKLKRLRAVIFDLDGVIVDSEKAHLHTFNKALAPLGVKILPAVWKRDYTGVGSVAILQDVFAKHGIKQDIRPTLSKRAEIYQDHVEQKGLQATPGIKEFFATLQKNGVATAIASGGHKPHILASMMAIGMPNMPFVGLEDVKNRKPAPDAFLLAAEKLGADPLECIVFEDSLAGIKAAAAAGMPCVALTTTMPRKALDGKAAIIINDFKSPQLRKELSRFIKAGQKKDERNPAGVRKKKALPRGKAGKASGVLSRLFKRR